MPALTNTELAQVHEMVGLSDYTVSDISDLAALLTEEQRTLVRADIVLWEAQRGKDTVVSGEVSVDPERKRRMIRRRTRERLGMASGGAGGLFNISVGGRA